MPRRAATALAIKPTHKPRRQVSKSTTFPPPMGGLNTVDSLPAMPPIDALVLRNFIPQTIGCKVRNGSREHAIGLTGKVCTIMYWNDQVDPLKYFAVDNAGIFDISTPGDYTGAAAIAVSNNPYWQYTNFGNAAGTHLIAFNGTDNGFWYSSAGYQSLTAGDGIALGTWSGVNPQTLIQVTVHHSRVWAVQDNTTLGWYLPPEQVYGVANSFDFGPVFSKGGKLMWLSTWTVDSGSGSDDHLIAASSAGQIAVYQGIGPDDPDDWKLVGVYDCGGIFSRRCHSKFGGDVVFMTLYGLLNLTSLMKAIEVDYGPSVVASKINPLLSGLASAGEGRPGWAVNFYPAENLLIVNVPGLDISNNFQIPYATITKGWCQFTNFKAECWCSIESVLMFGTTNKVYRALEGTQDNVLLNGTGGESIQAEAQQAFNYFQAPGSLKHFKLIRPTLLHSGGVTLKVGVNMDFDFSSVSFPVGVSVTADAIWNFAIWDFSYWAGAVITDKQWASIVGLGFAASIRLRVTASSEVVWVSTDWVWEPGGII